jgi:hypothetical protein
MKKERERCPRVKRNATLEREKSDRRPADAPSERDADNYSRSQAAEINSEQSGKSKRRGFLQHAEEPEPDDFQGERNESR